MRLAAALVVAGVLSGVTGCALAAPAGDAGAPAPPARSLPRSASSHVVVVVMENKEYGEVIGNGSAPYVNSLARRYALATRFYAITHPSLPNYLALTGGGTFGIDSDCTSCHVAARNVVDQLEGAGISWKAYMEGLPAPCFAGDGAGDYAKKHDPFLYYDDVAGDRRRCTRVVPATRLVGDLRAGRLPTFSWISPDLCHDTHDCSVGTGDRYLARLVPALIRELGPHGLLLLTWDEGTSDEGCCRRASGGHIATVVAGPDVRRGARSALAYDHYSLLRTVEDALGLPALGQAGCPCTRSLDALFRGPPRAVAPRR